uniref:CID domain-containing protein n=1 Tax=Syphacia muris TaxID=451379 RepID=A0A158R5M0_9BILA
MTPASSRKKKRAKSSSDDSGDDEDYIVDDKKLKRDQTDGETAADMDAEEMVVETSSRKSELSSSGPFLNYSPEFWSPLYLYRTLGDLTVAAIRQSGNEGIGRIEIGQTYGVDTRTKSGNRKVSTHILNSLKAFPDYFGQFQKLEGKFRCIKYYWKVASRPENFKKLFARWEAIVKSPCPFKMGQVIKFPGTKLSLFVWLMWWRMYSLLYHYYIFGTLRVSDVTLRRIIDIMDLVKKHRIIVTMSRFVKMLVEADKAHGCKYLVDKKSIMKCLLALQKQSLVKVFDTVVVDENVKNTIQLVCEWDVDSASHPEVIRAIRIVIDEFHENGRVFPHGQLKYVYVKKDMDKTVTDVVGTGKDCNEELAHLENELNDLTIEKRISLLRLQNARTTLIVQPSTNTQSDSIPAKADENPNLPKDQKCQNSEKLLEKQMGSLGCDSISKGSEVLDRVDADVGYGRQSKWNRCFVLHKLVFQFVRGTYEREKPTVFERFINCHLFKIRFPPGKPWTNENGTPLEECPVYVDKESPYRFVPPMPQLSGVPRGWFMLQDLINVMPLSVYFLLMKTRTKCPEIESYLLDPLRRHMLLNDLPRHLRSKLLNDKLLVKHLEHHLLTLCGLGLARLGQIANPKKVILSNSQFFFITNAGILRDTSTSKEGYANVTMPIDLYKDLELFWHHLRAVALSTKLSHKLLAGNEDSSRFKKYALSSFYKTHIYKPIEDLTETAYPVPPYDGCAGFDSAHLKRHWDINIRPPEYVDWFVAEWRRSVERVRAVVEIRVCNLERAWNSYLKSLIPSDSKVWKMSKVKDTVVRPPHKLRAVERKGQIRRRAVQREMKKGHRTSRGKRMLDELDVLSMQSRLHFRSRFSSRERDMLLLIRAVGFFLNPVYRFWLDPTVLRDIMHAYVPESRNKTVQSLMAAGVRELVRPHREMRELRAELASGPYCGAIEKRNFFYKAFEAAKKNLAMEAKGMPPVNVSDEVFNQKISANGVKIISEALRATPFPIRSRKPNNAEQIRHCVAFNVVAGMLLSEKDLNDPRLNTIVEQVSACSLSNVLEQLRIDGLLARQRGLDDSSLGCRGQTVLSHYFRHFFNHRFHSDIVELSSEASKKCSLSPFTDENNPGIIVASLTAFSEGVKLNVIVPETVKEAFRKVTAEASAHDEKQAGSATKQLRSLEKTDLRIESMEVSLSTTKELNCNIDVGQLIESLSTVFGYSIGAVSFEDYILNYPVTQRKMLRDIYTLVKEAGIIGISLDEMMQKLDVDRGHLEQILQELTSATQIFAVGIDCYRYVTASNSTCWLVYTEKVAFFPTPWMMPFGEVYQPTVRYSSCLWMSEGVLLTVVDSPGISMKDLQARFAFALQPRMLLDLLNLLIKCGCIEVIRKEQSSCKLKSPFTSERIIETVEYIEPTVNAIQIYSRLFSSVKLSNMLAGFRMEAADA